MIYEKVGDLLNPIIGWRSWSLCLGELLVGIGQPTCGVPVQEEVLHAMEKAHNPYVLTSGNRCPWTPGEELMARCWAYGYPNPTGQRHPVIPADGCGCGIYAMATLDDLKRSPYHFTVYGEVKLWGKVMQGTQGYRAQYAYPASFYVPVALRSAEFELLEQFKVLIHDLRELGEMNQGAWRSSLLPWSTAVPTFRPYPGTAVSTTTAIASTYLNYTTSTTQIIGKWQWVNNLFNKQDDQKK